MPFLEVRFFCPLIQGLPNSIWQPTVRDWASPMTDLRVLPVNSNGAVRRCGSGDLLCGRGRECDRALAAGNAAAPSAKDVGVWLGGVSRLE